MALKKRKAVKPIDGDLSADLPVETEPELKSEPEPEIESKQEPATVHEFEKVPQNLKEFEAAENNPFSVATMMQSVAYIHSVKDNLTLEMVSLLSSCIPHNLEEDIHLDDLVKSQLHSAVALKNSYFNINGSIKEGTSSKDAKDALASCQQIINVLVKQQEGLDRQSRLMKMENILIQCAMDLPEEAKQVFLDEVARQLEIQL